MDKDVLDLFRDDLQRIVNNPTAGESIEEVDQAAADVLAIFQSKAG